MSESAIGGPRLMAGRYELEALIGKGGIAEVWRARHVALNSFVAIKFLQGASAQNESTRRRFTTEAQVTAQLKSQHAVQVFDFGVTENGHPYLVMELLEGETLGRRIEREGRVGILQTARILGQSARALQKAHQLGIVHRDFKPENIIIDKDDDGRDFVKVVDFGIAKLVGELAPSSHEPEVDLSTTAPSPSFTKTGAMLGTPFYMAPEQVRNSAEVDLRADIWAFGVVAFECLTGCLPFTGDTLLELFRKIESGVHPEADKLEPSVPAGFQEWFDCACASDPASRFSDAATAWKALLVALDCGRIDIDPSMVGRNSPAADERHVIVGSEENAADGNAITFDVVKKGVEARQRRSLPKISLGPAAPKPVASAPTALSHSIDEGSAPTPTKNSGAGLTFPPAPNKPRLRRIAVAVPPLALVGVVAWRIVSADAPRSHVQTSPLAPSVDAALVRSGASAEPPPPVPVTPSPPAPPLASAVALPAFAKGYLSSRARSRPSAVVSDPPSDKATPSPPIPVPPPSPPATVAPASVAPASAAPGPADPGSYR